VNFINSSNATQDKPDLSANNTSASILSVDVEDGINVIMRDVFNIEMPPTIRVVENTEIILELFNKYNVKATFFVLGEVAKHYPSLIRSLAEAGNEIGVHGLYHDQIFKLSPDRVRNDLTKAKQLIEDIIGNQVCGFRAPAFSINQKTSWALNILAEIGFVYDSSIVPTNARRYGWANYEKDIHRINLKENRSIVEAPISIINFLGRQIPACGGGYLRHLPYFFTRRAFLTINMKRPVIVYLHPYEIDTKRYPDFFHEAKGKLGLRRRLPLELFPINKGTVINKIENLLGEFRFTTIMDTIHQLDRQEKIPERVLDN